ncbi:DUF1534 domain-containing protein [Pseudomonas syringae pv. tomato]|nr:DUF1534 domain-containing protein [Pseudomonas syringae]TES69216.1 DUF1534 domain-containing protein [Pseudomonas syringae pv. tomato]
MPFRDALRHNSALRCTFKSGRRASRTAFLRWSGRNDNLYFCATSSFSQPPPSARNRLICPMATSVLASAICARTSV